MSHRFARLLCLFTSVVALAASATVAISGPARGAPSTGASFVDYAQCANGAPPSVSLMCPSGWINGILQGANSHYREDQVTPQRASVEVPRNSPATGRTLTFKYQTRKGGATDGIHAYDSLTTWNLTQTGADRCQGLTAANCVPGGPAFFKAIPADTTVGRPRGPGNQPADQRPFHPRRDDHVWRKDHECLGARARQRRRCRRRLRLDHGHLRGDEHDGGPEGPAACSAATWRPTNGARGWGPGLGSSNISGGPYHIKFEAADGASIGNRDNQNPGRQPSWRSRPCPS